MDLNNLLSSLASFSNTSNKNEQPVPQSLLYPQDFSTSQNSTQSLHNFNEPQPPSQQNNLVSTLLPLILLMLKGNANLKQVLSKASQLSPALKNIEPLLSLFSNQQEKEQKPSISSYERIEK